MNISIHKRNDRTKKYQVVLIDEFKNKRKTVASFQFRKQAETFIENNYQDLLDDSFEKQKVTLAQFCENHMKRVCDREYKTKEHGEKMYKNIERYVLTQLGHREINSITVHDWEDLYDLMNTNRHPFVMKGDRKSPNLDVPYSRGSIKKVRDYGIKIYQEARRLGIAKDPSVMYSKLPKKERTINTKQIQTWTDDQIKQVLDYIKLPQIEEVRYRDQRTKKISFYKKEYGFDRDYFFYFLLSRTALRRGEILGLRLKNIQFLHDDSNQIKGAKITVEEQVNGNIKMSDLKDDYVYMSTKTSKPIVKYLSYEVTQELIKHLEMLDLESKESNSYPLHGLLFCKEDGSLFEYGYFSRKLKSLASKCGLPTIRLHELRHSIGTNLLAKGLDIYDVSKALHHSNIKTTIQYYVRPREDELFNKASEIDKMLSEGTSN